MEIRYNTETLLVTAWCQDAAEYGHLQAREGETIVVWDCAVPEGETDYYLADPDTETIALNPDYTKPEPMYTYWAKVKAFDTGAEKPMTVERTIDDTTYTVDVYVTERVKDLYQDGTLVVGDFVLIVFVDGQYSKRIATQKIYKSW